MLPKLKTFFTFSQIYRKPSPLEIAQAELEDAKRDLLSALTAQAYAKAAVDFNQDQVQRLTEYILSETTPRGAKK